VFDEPKTVDVAAEGTTVRVVLSTAAIAEAMRAR
jgi:hypothetical protein